MQDKFCACLWVLTLTLATVNCFPYKTANKLKTEPENSHQDACQEAPGVEGPCYARIPRYTFQSGQCIKFYYGGCLGNDNNFKTLQECEAKCLVYDDEMMMMMSQ